MAPEATGPAQPRSAGGMKEETLPLLGDFAPHSPASSSGGSFASRDDDSNLPTVEVRFENLTIEAEVHIGSRALPSVINFYRNFFEYYLQKMGLQKTEKRKFTILDNVSGVLKPGRLTLLLGPPGSGKSTLLTALAGKLKPGGLNVDGGITYNGHTFGEFVPQRTAAYVQQVDTHLAELTVRETLEFAARLQGVSHRAEEIRALVAQEKKKGILHDAELDRFLADSENLQGESVVVEYTLRILGIDICADTFVGDAMFRGVSGGQKKRVTTGEMLVGPQKTLFMDEISTGLDSSTTYAIVKGIRDWVHFRQATVLMALLQPAPETYDLFDDVMLISEGHVVFHGPREEVVDFFAAQGFRCPERKGTSDFLQEVTSRKDQGQYWIRDTPHEYIGVAVLAEAFQESATGRRNRAALEAPVRPTPAKEAALGHQKYELSGYDAFKVCLWREWKLVKRQSFTYVTKTAQCAVVGLIVATLFFRISLRPDSVVSGTLYNGMMFFSMLQMFFNGIAEMTFTIQRLPVFFKQRDNLLFPAWAYVLPTTLIRLPMSLGVAVIYAVITYYVVGLAPEPGRFFVFLAIMFGIHTMAVSIFRMLGALARNMIIANAQSSFVLLVVLLLGGFELAKSQIHPWWIWAHYIDPLTYAQNAISANEFTSPRWDIPSDIPGIRLGDAVLDTRGFPHQYYNVWIGLGVLAFASFVCNVICCWAHACLGPYHKAATVVSEEALLEREVAQRGFWALRDMHAIAVDINTPLLQEVDSAEEAGVDADSFKVTIKEPLPKMLQVDDPVALANSLDAVLGSHAVVPATSKRGMVLPFQPLTMTFHDIHYFVDVPEAMQVRNPKMLNGKPQLELLKGISGALRPGVLTSLMGVSGAGKTTLLDVLAGRKTGGIIQGDIRIDGFPKQQTTFARIAGYIEQFDVHSPQTTVQEALLFSAMLRFAGEIKEATVKRFVDEVMDLVELTPLSGSLVGKPGMTGLSVEQRKRLTIAVELVANPSIVFMDEPTSGLDARAAAIVMRTVRNIVNTGRTIVCTIHQPSIEIFEAFDELLLLKRGGETIFNGPLGTRSKHLVEYFQSIPGVAPMHELSNPAGWMLEVTTPTNEEHLAVDFAERFRHSSLHRRAEALISQLSVPAEGATPLHFPSRFAQSAWKQYLIIIDKFRITYWRTPEYNGIRFVFTVGIALIFGSVLWQLCGKTDTEQDIFNTLGGLYGSTLYLGIMNSIFVQPVIGDERMVFYRERAAGMYGVYAWYLALATVEAMYLVGQAIIYTFIVYFMCGFQLDAIKFLWFLLFMSETIMFFTFYGIMAVSVSANLQSAAVLSGAFYGIFNLFAGFVIPRPGIPGWWIWYYYLDPVSWTLNGLITSQLGDITDRSVLLNDGTTQIVADFLRTRFDFRHDRLGYIVLVLWGFIVLFWSVGAAAMKKLNFQKR